MNKIFCFVIAAMISTGSFAQRVVNDANAERRSVGPFHAVEVSGGIDLYFSQGEESVAVSASADKYRDRIRTEVKDGVLKIWYEYKNDSKVTIEWGSKKLKAYVSCKSIDRLQGSGGSDVDIEGAITSGSLDLRISGGSDFRGRVAVADLKINASGGSDVNITGTAGNLDLHASGGSDFNGYELRADNCTLDASGGSDVYITVNKELKAAASGGSDVTYKGTAALKEVKAGNSSSVRRSGN